MIEHVDDPAADSPIEHDKLTTTPQELLPPVRKMTINWSQKQGAGLQYGAICYWIVRRNESESLSVCQTIDFCTDLSVIIEHCTTRTFLDYN